MKLHLRDIRREDLSKLFEYQCDPDSNYLAAFTAEHPEDWESFLAKWERIFSDPRIIKKAILYEEKIVGHIAKFERQGIPEVTYWIGREYWGMGIATWALKKFLTLLEERPLYARVAFDNIASQKVLEKCGFQITGRERGFANARGKEIEEFIMVLKD
ncbi:MAG: N-acetyltransferase [Calditrichaeota bacterium]|nr:MAG: N-acetyltransferase [Calditrichota bacterium]